MRGMGHVRGERLLQFMLTSLLHMTVSLTIFVLRVLKFWLKADYFVDILHLIHQMAD